MPVFSQNRQEIDSLKLELAKNRQDTSQVNCLVNLCELYFSFQKDSATSYGTLAADLAKKINYPKGEANAYINLSISYRIFGDAPQSFQNAFKGLEISKANKYHYEESRSYYTLATIYGDILKDYNRALKYFKLAAETNTKSADPFLKEEMNYLLDLNFGKFYLEVNILDSSQYFLERLRKILPVEHGLFRVSEMYWSELQSRKGNMKGALDASMNASRDMEYVNRGTAEIYFSRAQLYNKLNQPDSSIYYAQKAIDIAEKISYKRIYLSSCILLADQLESSDIKQSLYYHKLTRSVTDEIYGSKKLQEVQRILAEEQEHQRILETERVAYQNRLKQYGFIAGLGIAMLIAFILYRNNVKEKKSSKLIQEQKDKADIALERLRATQSQLIQAEKMASLGELTAGIAHEIQNPLNFVNNFSELSTELITEMNEEIDKGNTDEVKAIASDIKQNLEKINHHGKRADAIVKGMMQHSQSGIGQKEAIDINALVEEYYRLAYHGFKAKDKSFEAILKTDFDPHIGPVNIVPQEIGRVLLNLFNNAFYAVHEKMKMADKTYEPRVTISTRKGTASENSLIHQSTNSLIISIKDNGLGIPEKIREKIFQPFFTTKPTGQGTGLGLSLSYDIVKSHGGEIKVVTLSDGALAQAGTEFIISLPFKDSN